MALWSVNSLGEMITKMATVNARKLYLAGHLSGATSDLVAEDRGILLRGMMRDLAMVDQYAREFDATMAAIKKDVDDFVPLIETAAAREMIGQIQSGIGEMQGNHAELVRLVRNGDTAAGADLLKTKLMPKALEVSKVGDKLADQQFALMGKVAEVADERVSRSRWTAIVMILLTIPVGIAVVAVVRGVNGTLRRIIQGLGDGSRQVASASAQLASSSQSLAQGASEQAASIEETSASAEEVNSMTRKNREQCGAGSGAGLPGG